MAVVDDDPFGDIKKEQKSNSPEPRDVNTFHTRSDSDTGPNAQHHTIGIGHNQAAAGDHNHDGTATRKVGTGLKMTCNTLSVTDAVRIQNILAMLHKIIDFTET